MTAGCIIIWAPYEQQQQLVYIYSDTVFCLDPLSRIFRTSQENVTCCCLVGRKQRSNFSCHWMHWAPWSILDRDVNVSEKSEDGGSIESQEWTQIFDFFFLPFYQTRGPLCATLLFFALRNSIFRSNFWSFFDIDDDNQFSNTVSGFFATVYIIPSRKWRHFVGAVGHFFFDRGRDSYKTIPKKSLF